MIVGLIRSCDRRISVEECAFQIGIESSTTLLTSGKRWTRVNLEFTRFTFFSRGRVYACSGNGILSEAVEATLGLYGVALFLSGRNIGIASRLRPFRIFATLYLYTCRRARQLM